MKTKESRLNLTIKERALLPDILPQQGNKLQQIIVRGLLLKVEFKSTEIDQYGLKFTGQGISWNEKGNKTAFDYELQDSEISILKEAAVDIDKNGKVTQHNLSLLEKIEAL